HRVFPPAQNECPESAPTLNVSCCTISPCQAMTPNEITVLFFPGCPVCTFFNKMIQPSTSLPAQRVHTILNAVGPSPFTKNQRALLLNHRALSKIKKMHCLWILKKGNVNPRGSCVLLT
ncbi:hypothetical protein VIGAN_11134500, partial [Vigna angularis var. angularis]